MALHTISSDVHYLQSMLGDIKSEQPVAWPQLRERLVLNLHAARCQCDGAAAALQQFDRVVWWICVQELLEDAGGETGVGLRWNKS